MQVARKANQCGSIVIFIRYKIVAGKTVSPYCNPWRHGFARHLGETTQNMMAVILILMENQIVSSLIQDSEIISTFRRFSDKTISYLARYPMRI